MFQPGGAPDNVLDFTPLSRSFVFERILCVVSLSPNCAAWHMLSCTATLACCSCSAAFCLLLAHSRLGNQGDAASPSENRERESARETLILLRASSKRARNMHVAVLRYIV